MKKIIKGKCYDTEKAESVGYWCNTGDTRDFYHIREELFWKSSGEFFLFGSGGPCTKYAVSEGSNSCCGSSKIIPLTWDEAREWAEKYLDGDEYEEIFGEVPEDDSRTIIPVSLSTELLKRAEQTAAQAGVSLSVYIESLLWARVRCAGTVILVLSKFCLTSNPGGATETSAISSFKICSG